MSTEGAGSHGAGIDFRSRSNERTQYRRQVDTNIRTSQHFLPEVTLTAVEFGRGIELRLRATSSHCGQSHRQLGPIKAEFLADPAQVARIEVLVRTTKRRLRRPPFSMHCHHDESLAALLLGKVEAAPLLG